MIAAVRALRPPGDLKLFGLAILLAFAGAAMIYSAGQVEVPSLAAGAWRRQLIWLVLALIAFLTVSRIPLRWLDWAAVWLYAASVVLLIVVLLFGTGPNTRSWLYIGPLGMQPAEFAKLATILLLARTFSSYRGELGRLSQLVRPVLIVLVPVALVDGHVVHAGQSRHQPASRVLAHRVGHLVPSARRLSVPLSHVCCRRDSRAAGQCGGRRPDVDPRGAGWHLIQSKVAIGSGGWFGQGFADGPQKRLAFLPEQHTDFIFSVIGEELGFLGVALLLVLLGLFLRRVLGVARSTEDSFASITVFCLFAVWFSHLIINVGMTVGLMPITGLPLPFLSYGGSFLLTLFVGLAIVARASAESGA